MTEKRFLSIARSLGYRPVQVSSRMGGLGFACSDGSTHFVRDWDNCVESDYKCSGKLTVAELLSCYHDLYRDSIADDGKPYVSLLEHFRDSNGAIWRVIYECGLLKFQITDCHGFYVLFASLGPGLSREKRYSTFDRAYNGILAFRRKYA